MEKEDKELLLKDLCARLSYGVILDNPNPCGEHWDELISIDVSNGTVTLLYDGRTYKVEKIKPYLRPMSSMTEEEKKEFESLGWRVDELDGNVPWNHNVYNVFEGVDWLNSHHFDYRGLIPIGLALEAKEGMYE